MARILLTFLLALFLPLVVLGQWLSVPLVGGSIDRFQYLNASANGQYQYITFNYYTTLKTGVINSDGSLGPRYSYPAFKAEHYRTHNVPSDTALIFAFTSNRFNHPALDTLKIATMVRGNFILDQNPTIFIASRNYALTAFKVAGEYVMQTSDSLYVFDCNTFVLKRKMRSEYGFISFFYEAGVLTGLKVENRGQETWLKHGTYNASTRLFVTGSTNIVKFNFGFYFPISSSNQYYSFGLASANDSITYPFMFPGQLVQKRGTSRYFYRKSNVPPFPTGAGGAQTFSITNKLDSVYFVDRYALPNGQASDHHNIYRFDRQTAQYVLVDSAFTDKTWIDNFHTRYGKAIIVADGIYPRIKQFPLSTPKEIEVRPEQPMGVYPNPATSSLHLRLGSGHVGGGYTILDAIGRTCLQGVYLPDQTIDIQGLAPGLYQVRVSTSSSTFTSRFVKL